MSDMSLEQVSCMSLSMKDYLDLRCSISHLKEVSKFHLLEIYFILNFPIRAKSVSNLGYIWIQINLKTLTFARSDELAYFLFTILSI